MKMISMLLWGKKTRFFLKELMKDREKIRYYISP